MLDFGVVLVAVACRHRYCCFAVLLVLLVGVVSCPFRVYSYGPLRVVWCVMRVVAVCATCCCCLCVNCCCCLYVVIVFGCCLEFVFCFLVVGVILLCLLLFVLLLVVVILLIRNCLCFCFLSGEVQLLIGVGVKR